MFVGSDRCPGDIGLPFYIAGLDSSTVYTSIVNDPETVAIGETTTEKSIVDLKGNFGDSPTIRKLLIGQLAGNTV